MNATICRILHSLISKEKREKRDYFSYGSMCEYESIEVLHTGHIMLHLLTIDYRGSGSGGLTFSADNNRKRSPQKKPFRRKENHSLFSNERAFNIQI